MMFICKADKSIPLPNILSKEKQMDLFKKMSCGDKIAREILITHNIKLVIKCINKYIDITGFDSDELIEVGIIGLIKSIDSFDFRRGYQFSTFSSRCIQNEVLQFMKRERKSVKYESYDKSISENFTLKDTIADDKEFEINCENEEMYNNLKNLVNNLSGINKEMIIMYFGINGSRVYTQKEISNYFGWTQSYTSKKIQKILELLKLKFLEIYNTEEINEYRLIKKIK